MKNFLALLFFILLVIPFAKAEAKIIIVKPTSSSVPVVDGFSVYFADPTAPVRLAVEVLDTEEDGIKQLGVYPSNQAVAYNIEAEGNWQYKAVDSSDDWQDIGSRIEENKILLKLNDTIETTKVEEQQVEEKQQIVLPSYDMRDDTSVSSDGNLIVDLPDVSIKKVFAPIKNGDLHLLSSFYRIESSEDYTLAFKYNETSATSKAIYAYNRENGVWEKIESYNDFPEKKIMANIDMDSITVAIFEDEKAKDGIASFYDQSRYRSFDYANGNFAASRDYPRGTKLKVTRLLSGDSIIIEVNDYGPELQTGRIIDLDISAFEQIGSISAGLIYVRVELYD
ncbi:hypothetical protein C0580_00015 [Candidatus Parcubacteria bacterium]|nr:MAG: hypothetical protein C0580_00015 [Candidatus Parcubacteria bacterium]